MSYVLLPGECQHVLRSFPDGSVDACVTDPPYELGFMGKRWDASGIAYSVDLWREVLRVLKPGAHLLAFGGTRTYHRMACAIEDAGFEIRDSIDWIYGTGFPKSLNVSKAIASGGRPEDIRRMEMGDDYEPSARGRVNYDHGAESVMNGAPAAPPDSPWAGWGTALKPAHEPIVVARKPLAGTVAENVMAHGTGGLNIAGCRIAGTAQPFGNGTARSGGILGDSEPRGPWEPSAQGGRWPANVVLDEAAAAALDLQSGTLQSGANPERRGSDKFRDVYSDFAGQAECTPARGADAGGASRFFYVAKPGRFERDLGCEDLPPRTGGESTDREDDSDGLSSPRAGAGRNGGARNFHPTVKPVSLMEWLCRLVTPPGGAVLDPFCGSGTTGMAAVREGFGFIGIERDPDYLAIAERRITAAMNTPKDKAISELESGPAPPKEQLGMFGRSTAGG